MDGGVEPGTKSDKINRSVDSGGRLDMEEAVAVWNDCSFLHSERQKESYLNSKYVHYFIKLQLLV